MADDLMKQFMADAKAQGVLQAAPSKDLRQQFLEDAERGEAAPGSGINGETQRRDSYDGAAGGAKAFGRGTLQGVTGGFSDELGGAVQSGLQDLANRLPAGALDWAGIDNRYQQDVGDVYRAGRNDDRRENDAAQAARPYLYGTGQVVGAIAPAVATAGAGGAATLGARGLGAAMAVGGATGLVNGVGQSKAEMTKGDDFTLDNREAVENDALIGGASGAIGGALGHVGGRVVAKVLNIPSKILSNSALKADQRVTEMAGEQADQELAAQTRAAMDALRKRAAEANARSPYTNGYFESSSSTGGKLSAAKPTPEMPASLPSRDELLAVAKQRLMDGAGQLKSSRVLSVWDAVRAVRNGPTLATGVVAGKAAINVANQLIDNPALAAKTMSGWAAKLRMNPNAFGEYGRRLFDAAARGHQPELQDYARAAFLSGTSGTEKPDTGTND